MKLKTYLKLLIPFGIIAVALRMIELVFGVEASTGFYVSDSVWPTIFNVYCVLVCVFFIVMFFFMPKEKKPQYRRYYHINKSEKIILMIASVLILAAAVEEFISIFIQSASSAGTVQSAGILDYLNIIFAVLVVLFSVLYATAPQMVVKNTFFSGFSVVFAVYYLIKMFGIFTDSASILSHAYGTYSILFYSITALFFMNFSKMLAGTPAKRLLFLFGMGAVFFGAARVADLVLSFIPGNPFGVPSNALTLLSDTAITVAEIFILIRLVRKIETKDLITSEENHQAETSKNSF